MRVDPFTAKEDGWDEAVGRTASGIQMGIGEIVLK